MDGRMMSEHGTDGPTPVAEQSTNEGSAMACETVAYGMTNGTTVARGSGNGTPWAELEENSVEIVGQVMRQQRRGTRGIAFSGVSPTRAVTTQLSVQVNEEDGEAYGIRLVFPPRSAEQEHLIAGLAEGDRVRVRGRLGWRETYDTRFATADDPLGRPAREMVVTMLQLERADEAAIDGSWVRVKGTVMVPPQIRRHEVSPSLEIARTSVQVSMRQPSSRPGSRAEFVHKETIPVDFPLELPNIGAALRAGNQVLVEGRLERFRQRINPERSALVATALKSLKTQLDTELEQLTGDARDGAARRGARQVRALLYEDRLRLRAGYVALINGELLDAIDVAITNRQEWTRSMQVRRERRQSREPRTGRPQHMRAEVVAGDAAGGNDIIRGAVPAVAEQEPEHA